MRILVFLFFILSFRIACAQAQQNDLLYGFDENINPHLSKSILVAGETLPFMLDITMNGEPTISQMAYADLISRNGKRMAGTIIPLHSGKASAYLKVPSEVPSDNYLLRIYTRLASSTGNEKYYHHSLITVINPNSRPQDTELDVASSWKKLAPENSIKLYLEKENLARGETSKLVITTQPEQRLTISISKKNPYLPGMAVPTEYSEKANPDQQLLPELRGHIVQGTVSENKIDTTKVFYLSAHGRNSALFLGKPNSKGKVYFELGALQNYDFLLLQTEQDSVPFSMSIQSPFAPVPSEELLKLPPLELPEQDKGLLNDLVLSYSTTDYYFNPEALKPQPIVTGFAADRAYNLDEYNRFRDLATTLKEYVPTVLVRKNDDKYHFKLTNLPENRVYKNNPLMLIDAMPVFDSDDIGKHSADSIERIEVINRNFYILDNIFEGVINFTSFRNDFGGFPIPERALYLEYPKIQQSLKWKYNAPNQINGQIPDFRTILYWNEEVKSGADGQVEIDFITSQITGEYEVKVSTVTPDGKQNWSTLDFRVSSTNSMYSNRSLE